MALLDSDARLTVREMSDRLDISKSTVHRIVTTDLDLSKISARWVPRLLTPELKAQRMSIAKSNIELIQRQGGWDDFSKLIISGDETWIPFFDPETKDESRIWAKKGSPAPVKARRDQHSRKVMLTLFFDHSGPLTIDFLEEGTTINADRYIASLTRLKGDVRNKWRQYGEKPCFLHHDNARPHTAGRTMEKINQLNF